MGSSAAAAEVVAVDFSENKYVRFEGKSEVENTHMNLERGFSRVIKIWRYENGKKAMKRVCMHLGGAQRRCHSYNHFRPSREIQASWFCVSF